MLHKHLTFAKSKQNLQMCVTIIVAAHLLPCLHHDEFHGLGLSSFQTECFELKDGMVDSVVLKVHGEYHKSWVHLPLWKCHKCPAFCPIHHPLIHLHIAGIKKGFSFPSAKEPNNPHANSNFVATINHSKFLGDLQKVSDSVLPERKGLKSKIGSHTFAKRDICHVQKN